MRIGFGYDVHALVAGRPLLVGGVLVPFEKGSLGHSDGDVLIHAIMDALLGAAALGDIGRHFPDTEPMLKDADSTVLLGQVMAMLVSKGFKVGNIDATVCLQEPKLSPYIKEMTTTMSSIMGIGEDQISIKATTTEHMGFTGRGEGISAYAVALIH